MFSGPLRRRQGLRAHDERSLTLEQRKSCCWSSDVRGVGRAPSGASYHAEALATRPTNKRRAKSKPSSELSGRAWLAIIVFAGLAMISQALHAGEVGAWAYAPVLIEFPTLLIPR